MSHGLTRLWVRDSWHDMLKERERNLDRMAVLRSLPQWGFVRNISGIGRALDAARFGFAVLRLTAVCKPTSEKCSR